MIFVNLVVFCLLFFKILVNQKFCQGRYTLIKPVLYDIFFSISLFFNILWQLCIIFLLFLRINYTMFFGLFHNLTLILIELLTLINEMKKHLNIFYILTYIFIYIHRYKLLLKLNIIIVFYAQYCIFSEMLIFVVFSMFS